MSEEIISPPWPTESTRVDTLFPVLTELHQWAARYRDVINGACDHALIPPLRDVPRRAVHDALPLVCHHNNFSGVRKIRELWDGLVRDHEESWDSKLAFQRRCTLVAACVKFLNDAWLSAEVREARQATAQQQFFQDSLAKSFGFLLGTADEADPDPFAGQ